LNPVAPVQALPHSISGSSPEGLFGDAAIGQALTPAPDFTGEINVAGEDFNQFNGPYDAKQIGDFKGLTPPL
jgi:hypothetical protein